MLGNPRRGVRRRLGAEVVEHSGLGAWLTERTEGSPLFAVQMVEYVVEQVKVRRIAKMITGNRTLDRLFRAAPAVQAVPGAIDSIATLEQLEAIAPLIPDEWFPAAVGSAVPGSQRRKDLFLIDAQAGHALPVHLDVDTLWLGTDERHALHVLDEQQLAA